MNSSLDSVAAEAIIEYREDGLAGQKNVSLVHWTDSPKREGQIVRLDQLNRVVYSTRQFRPIREFRDMVMVVADTGVRIFPTAQNTTVSA